MRYVTIAAVMVLGCSPGPAGPSGPAGERGPVGPAGDVSALQAELAAVKAELAEVKARPEPKQLHLVVKETGEDLGRMIDWQTAWNEKLTAPLNLDPVVVFYSGPNCTGDAVVSSADWTLRQWYAVGPTGEVILSGALANGPMTAPSKMSTPATCFNEPEMPVAPRIVTFTGVLSAVTRRTERAIELR